MKIKNQIGISAFAWTAHFTPAHLALLPPLRDHNITAFELAMFNPSDLPAEAIRRATQANDLTVSICAILPSGINPIHPDPAVRKHSIAHLLKCIHTAAEIGAQLICGPIYAPIGYLPNRRPTSDESTWAIEALTALIPTLESTNITLAIEPVNRSETSFLNTAAQTTTLLNTINHPNLGVTIDTFHANIEEKSIPQAIRSLGPHLKHLHLSENDRGLLGSGHINFPAILAALNQINYPGTLMIEGFGYTPAEPNAPGFLYADPTVTPEDIAYHGAAYLTQLLTNPAH